MKNYKNYLILLFISIACIMSGCKTKKVEKTPVNNQPIMLIQDENGSTISEEKAPEFPGGDQALMAFLGKSVRYPIESMKRGSQGRVICSFTIHENGRISDIESTTEIDPLLKKEAIRVIKSMPKWTPGEKDGEKVKVRYTLPIIFRLQ